MSYTFDYEYLVSGDRYGKHDICHKIRTDGLMNGRVDGQTNRHTEGWTDGQTDGRTHAGANW